MAVDTLKAAAFDCRKCDKPSQKHRNCHGSYPKATNLLNHSIYTQCPKALWLGSKTERNLFALYIDCRESKTLPDPGSLLDQTAFTSELFNYLDGLMAEYRAKKAKEKEEEVARARKEAEARRK